MHTITFKTDSPKNLKHLLRLAESLGIETVHTTNKEENLHAPIVGEAEMDAWLTKENGEKYSEEELVAVVKQHIHNIQHHG